MKLVSSQFRKRRLAVWAAGSELVPFFRARVFGPSTAAVQEESYPCMGVNAWSPGFMRQHVGQAYLDVKT